MPSTIIGSSTWNTRGIVLSSQSAQEQVNGLVNVQVEYTVPATKQQKIDQLFYVDAPPPIWPSVVNRGEMLTNNIYMTERTVERANGLVTVQASYVGGLQRQGFRGYFLREVKETTKRATAYNYFNGSTLLSKVGTASSFTIRAPLNISPSGALITTGIGTSFIFDERIKLVEFVRIGNKSSAKPPTFTRSDTSSILSERSGYFLGLTGPANVSATDLWIVDGPDEALQAGLLSFEKTTPVSYTETSNYLTPNVEVVTFEYRLTR